MTCCLCMTRACGRLLWSVVVVVAAAVALAAGSGSCPPPPPSPHLPVIILIFTCAATLDPVSRTIDASCLSRSLDPRQQDRRKDCVRGDPDRDPQQQQELPVTPVLLSRLLSPFLSFLLIVLLIVSTLSFPNFLSASMSESRKNVPLSFPSLLSISWTCFLPLLLSQARRYSSGGCCPSVSRCHADSLSMTTAEPRLETQEVVMSGNQPDFFSLLPALSCYRNYRSLVLMQLLQIPCQGRVLDLFCLPLICVFSC